MRPAAGLRAARRGLYRPFLILEQGGQVPRPLRGTAGWVTCGHVMDAFADVDQRLAGVLGVRPSAAVRCPGARAP